MQTRAPLMVRRANWNNGDDQRQLKEIRHMVFIKEQGVPKSLEWDNQDAEAIHLLAYAENVAIGCARLLPSGQIGRMAVIPRWRHRGAASQLLKIAVDTIHDEFGKTPFVSAQTSVRSLYEKAGFVASGKEFTEAGIPHIHMSQVT